MKLNIKPLLYYIHERESIRLAKEADKPWPWTKDRILQTYKFTNVHRLHDRTTQRLLKLYRVHASEDSEMGNVLMNCATNRYFGTADVAEFVGYQDQWNAAYLKRRVKQFIKQGGQAFTGAYIITNGGRSGPKEDLVVEYLKGLSKHAYTITDVMFKSKSWKVGFYALHEVCGFGGSGFMGKETLQDYLLTWAGGGITDADTWTPMGPGGRRGLNRLYGRDRDYRQNDAAWMKEMETLRERVLPFWDACVKLEGFEGGLSMHDLQFCLCETDKYLRVKLGQGRPRSKYRPPVEAAAPHLRNGMEIA